jgi:type I restriction enzyme S subunit
MDTMTIPLQIQRVFDKFTDKTKFAKLSDLGSFKKGKGIANKDLVEEGMPCVTYGQLYTSFNGVIQEAKTYINKENAKNSVKTKKYDILFPGSGETLEEIGQASVNLMDETLYAGGDIIIFTPTSDIDALYLSYVLNTDIFRVQSRRFGQGHSVVHVYSSTLKDIIVPILPLDEQKRIADILSTWDRAIELKDKLINKKTELLDATIQRYKRKLFKSIDFDTWTKTKLKKVFSVRKEKDYESEEQPLYSFTIENGVSPKTDRYNRSFLVKGDKKYKVTKFNDLVYNPANLKYGAISVNKNPDNVLISPIYETLYVKDTNKYDIDFFKYFLTTSEMISYYKSKVEGTLVERSAVKVDQFLLFTLDVPEYNVQKQVTNHLNTIDKSIDILKRQKEMLELQKKGLMQRLLTGQVRVQV